MKCRFQVTFNLALSFGKPALDFRRGCTANGNTQKNRVNPNLKDWLLKFHSQNSIVVFPGISVIFILPDLPPKPQRLKDNMH